MAATSGRLFRCRMSFGIPDICEIKCPAEIVTSTAELLQGVPKQSPAPELERTHRALGGAADSAPGGARPRSSVAPAAFC